MKKEKSLYDQNGHWVEEKTRIKGAIRRVFRLSPQMKETLQAARVELPPALKKDGTPGKKNQVRYRCAYCKSLFSQANVQVDHIDTVVPFHKKESEMTVDELARGIFCNKKNLQVLCSTPMKKNGNKPSCHRIKTNEENFIRDFLFVKFTNQDERLKNIDTARESYKMYLTQKESELRDKEARKLARLAKRKKT